MSIVPSPPVSIIKNESQEENVSFSLSSSPEIVKQHFIKFSENLLKENIEEDDFNQRTLEIANTLSTDCFMSLKKKIKMFHLSGFLMELNFYANLIKKSELIQRGTEIQAKILKIMIDLTRQELISEDVETLYSKDL
jgi:hypothetical protein